MNDLTFEYKGRKLYIYIEKLPISSEVVFLLCDVTDMANEMIDFSIKELAKVEILDYIKNDLRKDFQKTIVASKIISLKEFQANDFYITLVKIKEELLKEFDKKNK